MPNWNRIKIVLAPGTEVLVQAEPAPASASPRTGGGEIPGDSPPHSPPWPNGDRGVDSPDPSGDMARPGPPEAKQEESKPMP